MSSEVMVRVVRVRRSIVGVWGGSGWWSEGLYWGLSGVLVWGRDGEVR